MTAVELDPVFPIPLIAAIVSAAALVTIMLALRGGTVRPAWMRFPLVLLRLGVLTGLAWVLLNPVKLIPRPAEDTSAMILLDRSASMKLPTAGIATRWSEARGWVIRAREEALAKGLKEPVIAFFGGKLEIPESPAELDSVKPSGNETLLAGCLLDHLQHRNSLSPRQLIVVSDGCVQDRSEIHEALSVAAAADVSISTHLVGADVPPRNSWIASVDAPRTLLPQATATVRITVGSAGIDKDQRQLLIVREKGGQELASSRFRLGDDSACELSFKAGLRTTAYEAELVPLADEADDSDNRFSFTIEIASSKLRVLFVEGTHWKRPVGNNGHCWNEMELMTRAWAASGEIECECLTTYDQYNDRPNLVGVTFVNGEMRLDPTKSFPRSMEEVHKFDVILISDVAVGNFSKDQMQWVVDWVTERGGGFLMAGGNTSFDVGNYDRSPWERIIPVDMLAYGAGFMVKTFPVRIPDSVRRHPLWKLSDDAMENERILATLPSFNGMNRVKRSKPGAIVLAARADVEGDEPIIAAQTYGRGRAIAFLPDPNGGWGSRFITWGPSETSTLGPQIELGHGPNFHFDPNASASASGETPPHPSPYYGQYWVNLVKWLGSNSIRWHRERLAGRINATAAVPGKNLQVTAEVLTVSESKDRLSLDVGARMIQQGSPRIRLHYDRDAREFVGEIPIPPDIEGDEVQVMFDADPKQFTISDTLGIGIRRANREFSETRPDAAFMEQLAQAANGSALSTPDEAVDWMLTDREKRNLRLSVPRKESTWPAWPLLWGIIGLLCLEWALRRKTSTWDSRTLRLALEAE